MSAEPGACAVVMNPFLEACGAVGPLLLEVERPGGEAETHALEQPFVLIGRDPRCDLRLDHPDVSERHAYLQLLGGRLACVDLGSRVGISHGGRRGQVIDVVPGLPLRIGPFRVRWRAPDAGRAGRPPGDAAPVVLELSHRGVRASRCELTPGFALAGSAADCVVRLVDPGVSPYHAGLVRAGDGVWVVDLLGQGGVRLNGRPVGHARVTPGDAIGLGSSTVRLAGTAPPAEPPVPVPEPAPPPVVPPPPPAVVEPVVETIAAPPAPVEPTEPAASAPRAETPEVAEVAARAEAMFATLTALHKEQTGRLIAEIDRLREEVRALRADLQRPASTPAPRQAATPGLPALPRPSPRPTAGPPGLNGRQPEFFDPRDPEDGPAADVEAGGALRTSSPFDENIHALLCDRMVRSEDATGFWRRWLSRVLPGRTPRPPA